MGKVKSHLSELQNIGYSHRTKFTSPGQIPNQYSLSEIELEARMEARMNIVDPLNDEVQELRQELDCANEEIRRLRDTVLRYRLERLDYHGRQRESHGAAGAASTELLDRYQAYIGNAEVKRLVDMLRDRLGIIQGNSDDCDR